ncbi:MAG: hypothetical protein A3F70_14890 [Acidobacteria bacterium RIFCSPLOWO2_12_FULL_67_14]|nr:MAG: hypothetical protein A3H29_08810 [Acidobacteria bacterium RIFCSPLOWO2_02_FULL_67_21]OFW37518.1 MAG: hypothetical protein A3F70_14890 [Acidobacteria bacterium RIFCSPLOWO2_12_FULL_67_14]
MISIETLASTLVPTDGVTLLLRAAFLEGQETSSVLRRWQDQEEDPTQAMASPETVSLAPTLFANLQGRPILEELSPRLVTYLKTALVHEQLRLTAYRSILAEVLHELGHRNVRFLLTGGALNGETLYPHGLRHSHDIDLLVRPSERTAVERALVDAGFAPPRRHDRNHLTLLHAKGLPISLHESALAFRAYQLDCEDVFARAETYEILGHAVEGPGREDRFLQACINGITSDRRGVLWVGDSMLLARQQGLDGGKLAMTSQAANCELPVWIALRYLETRLALAAVRPGVRLTPEIRRLLETAAGRSGPSARETLLQGTWSGHRGSVHQHLKYCASAGEKLLVLKAKVLPSLRALTGSNRVDGPGDLPRFYWGRAQRLLRRAGAGHPVTR